MRDKVQTWTEQQERLLRAAQEVVNNAETTGLGYGYRVEDEDYKRLQEIVQEISGDAVQEIVAAARARQAERNAERLRQALKLECPVTGREFDSDGKLEGGR